MAKVYKLFKRLAGILLCVFAIVLAGFFCHVDRRSVFYSLDFKHDLLEKVKAPRIVFIGGSNVRFGINSQMFKDSLKINPINTAVSFGFGMKLTIDDIKPYLKPGDVVVLAAEYSEFYGETVWGDSQVAEEVNICPEDIKTLNLRQLKVLAGCLAQNNLHKLIEVPRRLLKDPTPIPAYESSTGIDQYGDTNIHWGMHAIPFDPEPITGAYNPETIKEVQALSDYVVNNLKGKLFLTYPSFAKSHYLSNQARVDSIQEVYTRLKIPVLGTVKDFVYDDSLFFNSAYHLNKTGGLMRSAKLIKEIRPYLK